MKTMNLSRMILYAVVMIGFSATAAWGAEDAVVAAASDFSKFGAGIGAGLVVIGIANGIGRFAAAAAESTARQPEAAADIRAAINLPLFLLEGAAIIALVVCLLIVLL